MEDFPWVCLEWYEAEQAIFVGGRREAEVIRKGITNDSKHSQEESIDNHIQSAGAERAVAKLLNVDWHASVNTFKDGVPDVGGAIEVRYRRGKNLDLIVREDDDDDRFFVLVRGALPRYQVIGWLKGKDAKQVQFWSNPGGYGFAFFVPDQYLKPITDMLVYRVGAKSEVENGST